MAKRIIDLVRSIRPLSQDEKRLMSMVQGVETQDMSELKSLLKQRKVELLENTLNISPQIDQDRSYIQVKSRLAENELEEYAQRLNERIKEKTMAEMHRRFASKALETIPKFIGMNIVGLGEVKLAAAVQLFARCDEPVHVLLLGDPGTGKTDILRSSSGLHPISSFGLGSGTSGVGLTVTVKGSEVHKGLLPLADKGICAIDELNLMEDKDRASLYNAMEKGFLTYDKAGKHYKFDARVRVIATANPKGDRFAGWTLETLKKQMPFDAALLSRFHLVFMIRKPDIKQFVEISRRIVRSDSKKNATGDEKYIQEYVSYAEKLDVELPPTLEHEIVDFVAQVKQNEKNYLIEVSPRIVLGFVRLAKAVARMQLRQKVTSDDIDVVKRIVTRGLSIK